MKRIACIVAVMFALTALANASLIATLTSVTPDGADFAFNYTLAVTADEALNPGDTNGVTCPGPGNTLVQCNPAGTFLTIYDIPGFVSASLSAAGWSDSVQNLGITPSTINASFDSSALSNVTFIYAGSPVAGPVNFTGFTIVSANPNTNPNGHFASQSTNNVGSDAGLTNQLSGSVGVPGAVPEPNSLVMMGAGLALAVAGMYRRTRRA
jgi:hypothetical protein